MGDSIGTATIEVRPDADGFRRRLQNEIDGPSRGIGKKIGAGFGAAFGLAAAAGAAALGAGAVAAGFGLEMAANAEQAAMSFEVLLGSSDAAKAHMEELADFAANTPFDLPTLQDASKRLLAVGVAAGDVTGIMTVLGDATSAMGTGAEGIDRATTALTQMSQKGTVSAEEMLQLTEAGIPAWDALASHMGLSVEEVQKLVSSGAVGSEEMFAAIENRAGEGLQKVSGMMEQQSQTLAGMFSTLKDTVGMELGEAAAPLAEGLKDQLPAITDALGGLIQGIAPVFESLGEVVGALTPALAPLGELVGSLGQAFGKVLAAAVKALVPVVAALAPVIGQLAGALGDALMTAIEALAPHLPALAEAVGALLLALMPLLPALAEIVIALVPVIPPVASIITLAAELVAGLAPLVAWLVKLAALIVGAVIGALSKFLTALVDVVSAVVRFTVNVVKAIGELPGKITGVFASAGKLLLGAGKKIVSGLIDGIKAYYKFLWDAANWIKDKIMDAFSGAGKWLYEKGKQLLQGFLDGLKSMGGAVGDFLGNLIPDFLRSGGPGYGTAAALNAGPAPIGARDSLTDTFWNVITPPSRSFDPTDTPPPRPIVVHVHFDDPTLRHLVRVEVADQFDAAAGRVLAGVR